MISGRASALCALVVLGGCSRVGPGVPLTPAPEGAPQPAEVKTQEPAASLDEPAESPSAEPASDEADLASDLTPFERLLAADEILNSPLVEQADIQERVDFWMRFWQGRGRENFERYLQRMGRYAPMIDREIAERGMPVALRFLPIVESGYNPVAVSRVGATGLWQFMRGTAQWRGLQVDGLVDERRDPLRSTDAALDYLIYLNDRFESWFLTLAAYNSGPGRVGRIVARYGNEVPPHDSVFSLLSEHFPGETQNFVPKLLAATRIALDPARFGFDEWDTDSLSFAEVEVPDATSLDVVARLVGAELEEVVALNPHLVQRVTPVGRPWSVRVPQGRYADFGERLAALPPEERVTFIQHRIARGETLSHVALNYGVSVATLTAANPGLSPRRLQIGQRLIIPRGPVTPSSAGRADRRVATSATSAASASAPSPSTNAGVGETVTHVVLSGESPWLISRRYGVRVGDLLRWNELEEGDVVRPGDELEVRGARVVLYRVQRGDTLSGIASRHGVSASELARANGLTLRSVIRPGDQVRIPVEANPGS